MTIRTIRGRIVLAIVLVGCIPLVIGLLLAYVSGMRSLRDVIGGNLQAVAIQAADRVTMLVRGAAMDRCNEENLKLVNEAVKAGRLQVWYNSSVQEIQTDKIKVKKGDSSTVIPNQFLFVFAGRAVIGVPFRLSVAPVAARTWGSCPVAHSRPSRS